MSETWKDIPGCEGIYQISDQGRVLSVDRFVIGGKGKKQHVPERILVQMNDSDGYKVVSIRFCNGMRKLMKVHRLVLLAFVGKSDLLCRHGDGVKTNNRLTNLQYGTEQENADDRLAHGSKVGANGEGNGAAKLTESIVSVIRDFIATGLSCAKIGLRFGVCAQTIRNIKIRKTWSHI